MIMVIAEKINNMDLKKVTVNPDGLVLVYGTTQQLNELEKYCRKHDIPCELNTWFSEEHKLEILL